MAWRIGDDARKIAATLRFGLSARRFVKESLTLEEARRIVAERIARREQRFLSMVQRAILNNPKSAYKRLFDEAGLDYARVQTLTRRLGVEGALEELRQRGVFVAYEEFKALNAEGRADLKKFPRGSNFDNPLSGPGLAARSGGSRSAGTRLRLDFWSMREAAVHRLLRTEEFGMQGAVQARYFPILPASNGITQLLQGNYVREPQGAWFTPLDPRRCPWVFRAQTAYVLGALRLAGAQTLRPQYVPLSHVHPIARWLAERKTEGQTCHFSAYASSAVRVCAAAREEGLDVSGTWFSLLGEPVTQARYEAVRAVGGVPIVTYGMAEAGQFACTCRHSRPPDDMHFFTDSHALIRHSKTVGPDGREVQPFLVTSLLPGARKILLNVETDDCGDLSERPCDCVWGRLGLTLRVSNVRSFVKLTTEGMTLLGTNLIHVIESELPQRFGGGPADYQLLEEEEAEGRGRLSMRISPSVGPVDEAAVLALLYDRVRSGGVAERLFGNVWEEAQALRVVRQEPLATRSGKILPFHTLR